MKKKNLNLALLGFASVSLILAGCQQAPSNSSELGNSSSTSSDVVPPDDDDSNIIENKIKLTSPAKDSEFEITPAPLAD